MGFHFYAFILVLVNLLVKAMSLKSGVSLESMAVPTATGGNETDRLALLAIKALITEDPLQITKSWNESLHFCQWRGVSCGRRHQRVTRLDLLAHRLKGRISPAIGNLSFLRVINLSNNGFQGEIPREVSRLFRLQVLALGNNSLVGEMPANLSFCSDLRVIYLNNNNLTGQLSFELGLLSRLVELRVAGNNLKGNIPPHLGNISTLQKINVALNRLEGHIPVSLGKLETLVSLQVSNNLLSGTIPHSIYNLSQLALLFVAGNQIEGALPRDVGLTLPSIERFVVWDNNFSGTIPASFGNASNLFELDISMNNFFGGVPDMFGNLKKLDFLGVSFNNLGSGKANDLHFFNSLSNCSNLAHLIIIDVNFGGEFPASIANFSTQLKDLVVQQNLISGNIPHGIENLKSLNVLALDQNRLSGTIPTTIGKLPKLQGLALSRNQFYGEIPSSSGNLTSLVKLWLKGNNLHGSIPSSLGNCKNLILLDLSSNALNGTIPQHVIGLPSMSLVFNLSRNHLVGPVPSEVGNMKNLFHFDISHNQLSNSIPESLGDCNMLSLLILDHNMFHGAIPKSFSSLISIEQMDLSHNNLSGEIPKGIDRLVFLTKLDLSFNALEGELPTGGVFSKVSAISVFGNDKLCGGIPQLRLRECPHKSSMKQSSFGRGKLIITIVFGVLAISLMLYFLSSWWFKKERIQQTESSPANAFATISYGELLNATNGFSSGNLIGVGSTGSVYKGILEPNHTTIAVKVFNLQKRGVSKSFVSECQTLRSVRHRNLIKIITACSSMDYQGNEFKALVYEFMEKGSLESLLHPNPQAENPSPLTLPQRIDIAIDVASAVDYLHNHVENPVIHCDIKPSNVLLDQENIARVGDFGLSRIIRQENEENSHNYTSSSGLKGTIGYAAPEYGMGSKVSMEGDIYSFGIFLLEMFTGKRPTDSNFEDGMNLNQFVTTALPERVMEIVYQSLREVEEGSGDNTLGKICECCVLVLKVGVMCSDESPRERLKIDEALKQLCEAKNMLLGR